MKKMIKIYIMMVFVLCLLMLSYTIVQEITSNAKAKDNVTMEKGLDNTTKSDIMIKKPELMATKNDEIVPDKIEEKVDDQKDKVKVVRQLKQGEYYGKSVFEHYNAQKDKIVKGIVKFNIIIDGVTKSYVAYNELTRDIKTDDIFTKGVELNPNQTLKSYTFTRVE